MELRQASSSFSPTLPSYRTSLFRHFQERVLCQKAVVINHTPSPAGQPPPRTLQPAAIVGELRTLRALRAALQDMLSALPTTAELDRDLLLLPSPSLAGSRSVDQDTDLLLLLQPSPSPSSLADGGLCCKDEAAAVTRGVGISGDADTSGSAGSGSGSGPAVTSSTSSSNSSSGSDGGGSVAIASASSERARASALERAGGPATRMDVSAWGGSSSSASLATTWGTAWLPPTLSAARLRAAVAARLEHKLLLHAALMSLQVYEDRLLTPAGPEH